MKKRVGLDALEAPMDNFGNQLSDALGTLFVVIIVIACLAGASLGLGAGWAIWK